MINKIEIDNFRLFKHFEMDGIKRINLIAGQNNVGKSTLLEAVFLYFASKNLFSNGGTVFQQLNAARNFNPKQLNTNYLWEHLFYNYDNSKNIKLKVDNTALVELKKGTEKEIKDLQIPQMPQMPLQNSVITDDFPLKIHYKNQKDEATYILSRVSNNSININANIISMPFSGDQLHFFPAHSNLNINLPEAIGKLLTGTVTGLKYSINNLIELSQSLDNRIEELFTANPYGETFVYAKVGNVTIPINFLGDGINKLLSIFATIYTNPNSIILIDEIENGFHYSFYPKLWEMLGKVAKETNCQIFATTHSYECIEGATVLNENEPELFGFIRLVRDEENIIPKNYANDVFEYALKNNWEVR
jgi:AAA15 family ATPase/GTPase